MWNMELFGYEFYYLFYVFILYGIVGWIYESSYASIKEKSFVNRGFLTGPIIPIYGCGALLFYLVFWDYRDQVFVVFIGGAVLATFLEYITSFLMEAIFHTRWWDYSNFRINLNGRVALLVSLFWGVLACVMLNIIHPGMDYLIKAIPEKIGRIMGHVITAAFILDMIDASITSVKLEKMLAKLQKLRQDMMDYIETTSIYESGEELRERISELRLAGFFSEIRTSVDEWIHSTKLSKERIREITELKPEIEEKMKEFFGRYQKIQALRSHIRLLTAFPSMKVNRREIALSDFREKITLRGVKILSKDIKEEVTGTIKGYLSGFLRATLAGLLVLSQFVLIISLSYLLRGYTIYFYTIIQVLSIIIIIALVNDNRNASYKISWICIIAAFPFTGHIMFMLWGNTRRKKIDQAILIKLLRGASFYDYDSEVMERFTALYPTRSRLARYLEKNTFPLYKNNRVDYYPMGEDAFEAIFDEMEKAQKFILINFFIIGEGALWDRMHKLLLDKIKDGVRVMFLYDDFGAMLRTPRHFKRNLESEGIEVRVFNPVHKYTDKLYMNFRSHQKIIVIDGNVGFTGGMNLADEYVNLVHRFGIWKDNAVRVEGDAVWGLTVTFLQMWEVSSGNETLDYNFFRPTKIFPENDVYCQVVSDGPANNPRNPVENIYKQMIYYAKRVLYITTPYLIIEDDMRDALITAAASGIDVRIITPYIPDKKNVKILTNYNYGRLLEAGVRIFEYTPGFIHAKTILTEDSAVVGTINMDYRSFHLHYECGVWICDRGTVKVIKDDLLKTMKQSREITYEEWKNRPLTMKIQQLFLNLLSTLM